MADSGPPRMESPLGVRRIHRYSPTRPYPALATGDSASGGRIRTGVRRIHDPEFRRGSKDRTEASSVGPHVDMTRGCTPVNEVELDVKSKHAESVWEEAGRHTRRRCAGISRLPNVRPLIARYGVTGNQSNPGKERSMYYGGDYNPEQWPEEVWTEDVALMRAAGVNMVSLGIFSWSRLQPAEGEFDFAWLDRIVDLLHDAGIAVDMATATASPPPWMHESYPQILPVTQAGVTLGPGSRQHYSPSSPEYRRLAGDLVSAIAGRYAEHPAVVMWHVNNEYGCHVNYDYSDAAAVAFRQWLGVRYGSVEKLNEAWGTSFWSQRYTRFSQVLPPRAAPYSHNPGQLLDLGDPGGSSWWVGQRPRDRHRHRTGPAQLSGTPSVGSD